MLICYSGVNGLDLKGFAGLGCNWKSRINWQWIEITRDYTKKKEKLPYRNILEASSSLFDGSVDNWTTSIIKNQPRIRISHEEPSEVSRVHNDIKGIMQYLD